MENLGLRPLKTNKIIFNNKSFFVRLLFCTVFLCTVYLLFTSKIHGANLSKKQIATISSISYYTNAGKVRVQITSNKRIHYKYKLLKKPLRLYFDLSSARLKKKLYTFKKAVNKGPLVRIRSAQNRHNVVRVVLDLNQYSKYSIIEKNDPFRLVIEFSKLVKERHIKNNKLVKKMVKLKKKSTQPQKMVIVIDPGHGGGDPGAIGRKGTLEKDVVLDIAFMLKKIIEARNIGRVIMTRHSDKYIPIKKRTAIANDNNASIFISIHANASTYPSTKGIETYYLSQSTSREVLEIAERENAGLLQEENLSDLQFILADMRSTYKINESSMLAGYVQKSIISELNKLYKHIKNLGAKPGPFYVLHGAQMPSILVETSFISNPIGEIRLNQKRYKQHIAKNIYTGIKRYLVDTKVAFNIK